MPPKPTSKTSKTKSMAATALSRSSSRLIAKSLDDSASEKSSLFNLPDPNWLTDGCSDPAKADQRKEAASKAARTRKSIRETPIPGTFPTEEESRVEEESVTMTATITGADAERVPSSPVLQPLPPPPTAAIVTQFEGRHALVQPSEITRQVHAPSPFRRTTNRQLQHQSPEYDQDDEEPEASTTVGRPQLTPLTLEALTRGAEVVPNSLAGEPSQPKPPSSHRSSQTHRHSEEILALTEAVKNLQRSNEALHGMNRALQEEMARVRSRKSSRDS